VQAWVLVKYARPRTATEIDTEAVRAQAERDYEVPDNDNPLRRVIRFDLCPEVRHAALPLSSNPGGMTLRAKADAIHNELDAAIAGVPG
jgi:hypothetical protein